ncbi:sulfotransferase [Colwellia sp. 4_MG-2023]|uniref:tetratricopeptide repeat-containing sulfotransferase family protein n=1 Tax=unclassified Colwellia TaxID=196834 RepID=UPI001C09436E|nr:MULTISPECIES: sulfotransferase [unclassified Colwellia]MBU2924123.1 sulfotransferase [Colwellia sp. C2M11]MDO6506157.1 sulfotransferase [Colwellia sp. 5_MG-2023]MDO6554783.1 sulfotransferase [Colwellia sp. 4_MG-2023]MDO6652014.1 sulfotransferase [Colwellia sp. 3_MG-2023]MDO6664790.1 sulfotransferase [Colwellia sp. 2_MG-2023]
MEIRLKQLHQNAIRDLNQGNIQQAHKALVELVTLKPDFADGYFLMAMVNLRVGQIKKAIGLLERTLSFGDSRIEYTAQLAKCYAITGQLELAKKTALRIPLNSITLALDADTLGVALTQVGLHEYAVEYFERALTLCDTDKPQYSQFYYNYGVCAKFLGLFTKAERAFEQAIILNPLHHQSHFALADLTKANVDKNHIARLEKIAKQVSSPDALLHIGHALAKEYQDIGDFNSAYLALLQGKMAKHHQAPFDNNTSNELFEHIKKLSEDNQQLKSTGNPTCEPIFVLGMPRSGTTLVERILSSHSDVQSAGELQDFGLCVKKLTQTPSPHVLDIETLNQAYLLNYEQLGSSYLQSTRVVTGGSKHFIDKLPFNFYYIDLITKALPNAKIICLLRDPMDTCIGNYRQLFSINNPYYSYSLNLLDTAKFYSRFHKLVEHFQSLHNTIKLVKYEELVANPDQEIKSLVEFCDIEWQHACIDFHLNDAPVSTASKVQVRQPLNNKAIGRWRAFKPHTDEIEKYLINKGVIKS